MDLEKKYTLAQNKVAIFGSVFVCALVALLSLAEFVNEGFTVNRIFRLILGVGVGIFCIVMFNVKKTKRELRFICSIAAMAVYTGTLLTSSLTSLYGMMYAIIVVILAFADRKLLRYGSIYMVVILLINNVLDVKDGALGTVDAIIEVLLGACVSFIAIRVSMVQREHSVETISAVEAAASEQKKTADEIVRLAEELNAKFESAKETSEALNNTMDTTHASVNEISEGSRMTAEAIEQQTQQTVGIQESIRQVDEQAKNISEVSARTAQTVDEGVALINKLRSQAVEVEKINVETSATTEELNNSIKDVQEITQTILGISSQTNLLALNASIEAARAGEAGKGFAVVADEIRNLSESTRVATEKIAAIISKLTKDAELASESMKKSADYANEQNTLIEETGEKLVNIKEEADELNEGVMAINGSVAAVLDANTLITDSIANLSATSQEVAASTETVLTVSEDAMRALEEMNEVLRQINDISETMERVAQS